MSAPILILPLDDRPVNLDFPPLLAAVAGEKVVTPDPAMLGRFLQAGNTDALATWLAQQATQARAIIVSLDMLAYGGLVASRTPSVSAEQALQRLQVLRDIKRVHPALHIYAFSVIMRLTITGADPVTRAAGRDIFRYSVLADQAERLGDADAARELADVTARIPRELLEAYLGARRRNHAVNRAAVEMLGDGILDFLALVQEDTAPAGLHVPEQQALYQLTQERADAANWRVYPGTDEAAMTLLARYLLHEAGLVFPVEICQRDIEAAQFPALFEDVPLAEATRRHLDAVGGVPDVHGMAFAVHTFTPPQPDLFDLPALPAPTWEAALQAYPARDVAPWLARFAGRPCAVADVAYCNGGDPQLLDVLLATGKYWTLQSYAGWNTAGNTLGTAFAHAALRHLAQSRGISSAMATAHETAMRIRLLDDGLYQSVIRAWAAQRAEYEGLSGLNLAADAATVEHWVNDAMHALWQELLQRHTALTAYDRPFRAILPWGRLFEVRICVG